MNGSPTRAKISGWSMLDCDFASISATHAGLLRWGLRWHRRIREVRSGHAADPDPSRDWDLRVNDERYEIEEGHSHQLRAAPDLFAIDRLGERLVFHLLHHRLGRQ